MNALARLGPAPGFTTPAATPMTIARLGPAPGFATPAAAPTTIATAVTFTTNGIVSGAVGADIVNDFEPTYQFLSLCNLHTRMTAAISIGVEWHGTIST